MMHRGFESQGFQIGEVARIRIYVHWLLVIFWLLRLNEYLPHAQYGYDRKILLLWWAQGIIVLFGSILLHEFGHAFAARRVGGRCDEVVLWPLGGLAFCEAPDRPRPQLLVAAGGPAVTLALFLLGTAGAVAFPPLEGGPESLRWVAGRFFPDLIRWNLILFLLNIVPLYPLDGGRIFLNAAWGLLEWRNTFAARGRAVRATIWAARVSGVGGILFGLQEQSLLLVALFAWGWYTTEQLRR